MIVFFWRNSVLLVFPPSFDKMHQDGDIAWMYLFSFRITWSYCQKLFIFFSITHKCGSQKVDQHLYSSCTLQSASWILEDFLFPLLSTHNVFRNNNVRCCTQLLLMMIILEILGHYGMTWEYSLLIKKKHGVS